MVWRVRGPTPDGLWKWEVISDIWRGWSEWSEVSTSRKEEFGVQLQYVERPRKGAGVRDWSTAGFTTHDWCLLVAVAGV